MKKLIFVIVVWNLFLFCNLTIFASNPIAAQRAAQEKCKDKALGDLCNCPGSTEPSGLCSTKEIYKDRKIQKTLYCNCNLNTLSQEEFEEFSAQHNGNYPTDAWCARKPPFGFDDREITELMSAYADLLYKDQLFQESVPNRQAVNNALVATANQIKDDLQTLYGLDVQKYTNQFRTKVVPLLNIYESPEAPQLCEERFKKILKDRLASAGIKTSLTLTANAEKMLRDICQKNEKRTNLDPCFCKPKSRFKTKIDTERYRPGICQVNKVKDTGKLRCHCE